MRQPNLNMKGSLYPRTKNYYQKVFFRKVFGKNLYKFFKVFKIVLLYKIGKSFEISDFLKRIVKEDFVIFDIGANLGQYAIRFSSFLKGNGKVISVEPVYDNYLYLKKIKDHYKLKNLECCNYAVSDTEIVNTLYIPLIDYDIELDTRATINLDNYYFKYDKYKTQEIKITTLQILFNIFNLTRLDIIKSDTEGNDNKVILGSMDLIRKYTPLILIEDSHTEDWLTEIYNTGYLPFYVKKKYFLVDAFATKKNDEDIKYDLLVLIHKDRLNNYYQHFYSA